MRLHELTEGLRDPEDNPCWKGYKPVGTKKKAGRTVPNCVPVKEVKEKDLRAEFFLKQLRNRYPQAADAQAAMMLDYAKSQGQDRRDINRLDQENDQEQADIDRLDQENNQEQQEIDRLKKIINQLNRRI
jgi:peptidoglycan hydrolase CwlO-like protein